MRIGVCGAGQFSGSFAHLWNLHPGVTEVHVTDLIPERSRALVNAHGLTGTFDTLDDMLASDLDAIAIMTQRWTHGPLVEKVLRAGKHCYSAVPMALSAEEIGTIIDLVKSTGLTYMMGETSYYNPAVVNARAVLREGKLGRVFYSEGDYVHDMDNGFYAAYQYSGGDDWKSTASFPPMLYPTHAVGGVLGALATHAVSVSCIGIPDQRDDGVFDRDVSLWRNDFSNMSGLFELADGGVMRTNEFRRVGHPAQALESCFSYYGTEGKIEQNAAGAVFTTQQTVEDITPELNTSGSANLQKPGADAAGHELDPALRHSFESGLAPVHDAERLPAEFSGARNGHEGAHHFLADDFVRAVSAGVQPPVNAWVAARFTLPGIVAMESARRNGERMSIPDHGDCPFEVLKF